MLKFKYNYLTNTLAYQTEPSELWYQIAEEQQFFRFNNQGFTLNPANHWIQFTVYEKQIKAFYKQKITYYRKYLAKEETIIFEFSAQEEVEKVEGRWIRKGVNHD